MDAPTTLIQEENRRIRLLRLSADLLVRTLMTTPVTMSDADTMIQGVRMFALKLFPDKGEVFDLIYLPRFRRALREAGVLRPGALAVLPRHLVQSEPEDRSPDTAH
jgi:hypothetical protein